MTESLIERQLKHELQYQVRRRVGQEIRQRCPDDQPMITGVTVMLGTVLAMAVFCAIIGRRSGGRSR